MNIDEIFSLNTRRTENGSDDLTFTPKHGLKFLGINHQNKKSHLATRQSPGVQRTLTQILLSAIGGE